MDTTADVVYSHTYQKLPLIPVEEFLALHPEHADDDENALMIARIGHERAEREALEQQRLELVGKKQKLMAENKKRKDDLANLDKDLERFIDVSSNLTGNTRPSANDGDRPQNPSKSFSKRLLEKFVSSTNLFGFIRFATTGFRLGERRS